MDTSIVFVYYNGTWVDRCNFVNFEVTGVLIPVSCSFKHLNTLIYDATKIDHHKHQLEIQFQPKQGIPPMRIKDENSLQFYIHLRKKCVDETLFPLLVTIKETTSERLEMVCVSGSNSRGNDDQNVVVVGGGGGGGGGSGGDDDGKGKDNQEELLPTSSYVVEQENVSNDDDTNDNHIHECSPDIILLPDEEDDTIRVNQMFQDKRTLVNTMSMYSIRNNHQHRVKRSSSEDYVLVCLHHDCPWYFRASKCRKTEMYKVRKFNKARTCLSNNVVVGSHRQATSTVVGDCIKTKLLDSENVYTPSDIVDDMNEDYSVSISYQKAWRAKQKALELTRENQKESYHKLPGILYMLQKCNPGTKTDIVMDSENKFKYLFFAMGSSIKGWHHCTPIIFVDWTFSQCTYGEILLTASAQNANRGIFPLAFAVVDSENANSWNWFLTKVKETYGERDGQCVISNRHESIEKATKEIFPNLMHGVCSYHLLQNIKKKFRKSGDEVKDAFNGACRAYNADDFEKYMNDLDGIDDRIRAYLRDEVGYENWTRVFINNTRYSTMTSNIVEFIDASIEEVQELTIATLLECLRCLVQNWYSENKNKSLSTHTHLAKKAEDVLCYKREKSLKMKVETLSELTFIVKDKDGNRSYTVDLEKRTCSCKCFQYDEMPCSHAMCAISNKSLNCYDFCSYYYTKEAYVATYEESISPLGDPHVWDIPEQIQRTVVLPPQTKRPIGRPPKKRYKGCHGKTTKNKCLRCHERGHNVRTCKNEQIEKASNDL
ncbi:hypothetical protein CsatA_026641 [Cannabis sativa]